VARCVWAQLDEDIVEHLVTNDTLDMEISKVNKQSRKNLRVPQRRQGGWLSPPAGDHKLTADGAVSRSGSKGAVGVVCHDINGNSVGASTCCV
jgi:hypothetical protein